MPTITKLSVRDIRFPTSRSLDGSDAMNAAPDYSAAYAILETDSPDGLAGHGLTFTIGRGTRSVVAAVECARRRSSWAGVSKTSPPTWARSGARSPPTASCAGSAPTRA